MLLNIFKVCLLLFSTNILIKALTVKERETIVNSILGYHGWKNIKDVDHVIYHGDDFYFNDFLQFNSLLSLDKKIRVTNRILGCTYANFLKDVFLVIEKFGQMPECAKSLLNVVPDIVSFVIKMKGAMYAVDNLHSSPWCLSITNNPMCNAVFEKIIHLHAMLQLLSTTPCDEQHLLITNFNFVVKYFKSRYEELKIDVSHHCRYAEKKDTLWDQWYNEHNENNLQNQGIDICHFVEWKIKTLIQTTVEEKYFKLGFTFNLDTQETSLPIVTEGQINDLIDKANAEEFKSPEIDFLSKGLKSDLPPDNICNIDKNKKPYFIFFE